MCNAFSQYLLGNIVFVIVYFVFVVLQLLLTYNSFSWSFFINVFNVFCPHHHHHRLTSISTFASMKRPLLHALTGWTVSPISNFYHKWL